LQPAGRYFGFALWVTMANSSLEKLFAPWTEKLPFLKMRLFLEAFKKKRDYSLKSKYSTTL